MSNPQLKETILGIVENQIAEGEPPETRQTLKRLQSAGYSRQEAVEMIGRAVVEEIWNVWHENRPFDQVRFKSLLDALK